MTERNSQNHDGIKRIENTAFTHSGKFHADDVFTAALLTYLNPELTIVRANTVPEDFQGIIFDIGGGEFDHHQTDKKLRENGEPYAAFGLVWERFGHLILDEEDAKKFEEEFVQPIDNCDNTGCYHLLSHIISDFNPPWDVEKDQEQAFDEAKIFALTILQNRFESILSVKRAEGMVTKALKDVKDKILILPQSAPWKSYVVDSDVEFVIYPSNRGGYNGQAVPSQEEDNDKQLKITYPIQWAGLRDEELESVSGIKGLRFCHNSLFLIASDTLEGAIAGCRKAQELEQ